VPKNALKKAYQLAHSLKKIYNNHNPDILVKDYLAKAKACIDEVFVRTAAQRTCICDPMRTVSFG
jgi:hypothetical protein